MSIAPFMAMRMSAAPVAVMPGMTLPTAMNPFHARAGRLDDAPMAGIPIATRIVCGNPLIPGYDRRRGDHPRATDIDIGGIRRRGNHQT